MTKNDKVLIITCPIKPWGIGITTHKDGSTGYGYPETTDPTKFHPDYEVCSEEEIKNHEEALKHKEE